MLKKTTSWAYDATEQSIPVALNREKFLKKMFDTIISLINDDTDKKNC